MKQLSYCLLLALVAAISQSAQADKIAQHWLDARAKWNPVADRYVAGDESALQEMLAALEACGGVSQCLPETRGVTTAQAEASAIAVNIAWLYKFGKGGLEKNQQQADNYYYLASRVKNPWGVYNYAAYLEAKNTDSLHVIALKYAGSGGLVAGYLDAARIYDEKLDMPEAALHYYKVALDANPTRAQKERASRAIARLQPLIATTPQASPAQQTATVQQVSSSAPSQNPEPVRTRVVENARQCISEIRDIEADKRKTEEVIRRVNSARGSLNAEKNMLDINFGHIPQGGAGAVMRRQREIQYNAYYQRLNQWEQEHERAEGSIKKVNHRLRDYNQQCVFEIREAEYKQVCSNNSGNTFCRSFPNFSRN